MYIALVGEVEGGCFMKLVKQHRDPVMFCSILFGTKHRDTAEQLVSRAGKFFCYIPTILW